MHNEYVSKSSIILVAKPPSPPGWRGVIIRLLTR
jgi:hypothetical protein